MATQRLRLGPVLLASLALAGCGGAATAGLTPTASPSATAGLTPTASPSATASGTASAGASAIASGTASAGASAIASGTASAGVTADANRAASGIPAALVRQSRPIGRGPAFHPPASGPVLGQCRRDLGPRQGVHVELFAANRVVLVAAGIGARPPLGLFEGRIAAAGCFGALATLEPTGVVLVRRGARLTIADLFRSWGQPLSAGRMASFHGRVRVYVAGRPRPGPPGHVPLAPHAEIVLEVGPYVPPHAAYHFPPGS